MEKRTKRLAELTAWLMSRPDAEKALCANYPVIKDEAVLGLMRELRERDYHELFALFLLRGEYGPGVQRALDRFCLGTLLRELERTGMEKAFEEFEKLLAEEAGAEASPV